jgi:hypothetical protein
MYVLLYINLHTLVDFIANFSVAGDQIQSRSGFYLLAENLLLRLIAAIKLIAATNQTKYYAKLKK